MVASLALNSRYSFFTSPPTNFQNINYSYTFSVPLTVPAPNAPITFIINSNDAFINFSESYLRFKLRMTRADGTPLRAEDDNHQCFVPNTFHALFDQVKVAINGYPVSPNSDCYAYKAYIEELFSQNADTKNDRDLTNFLPDEGDHGAVAQVANPNWLARAAHSNRSATIELSGFLNVDFLRNSRNIPPNCKIEIMLFPKPAAFVIHVDPQFAAGAAPIYHMSDFQYIVRREVINSSVHLAIEQKSSQTPMKFYYPLAAVKQYHLTPGIFHYRVDDLWSGQIPTKIIVGFVAADNYNGTYVTKPFYFNPGNGIQGIEFYKNNANIGIQRAFDIDIGPGGSDKHVAYRGLSAAVHGGGDAAARSLPFSITEWTRGKFFYGIDLTPDGDDAGHHRYPTENGTVGMQVTFRAGLNDPLIMLVYSSFQDSASISQARRITTTVNI